MGPTTLQEAHELMREMRSHCGREREALCQFLEGLAAIEAKALHLHLGFPNMFALCHEEFGLSEGCIYRRLQVARKLRHYPELLEALRAGKLNLTLASMLCPYLGKHSFAALLSCAAGRTKREAQKALRDLSPELASIEAPSRIRYLGKARYSYRLKIPATLHHQWERVRELLSHQIPDGDIHSILQHLTQSYLAKNDPRNKAAISGDLWQHYSSPSRYIPKGLKQLLMNEAGHQCQYQSPEGRRCSQKRYLDIDHILPLAAGGLTERSNLQILCHAHNLLKSDHIIPSPNTNHNQSDIQQQDVTRALLPKPRLQRPWESQKVEKREKVRAD